MLIKSFDGYHSAVGRAAKLCNTLNVKLKHIPLTIKTK